MSKCLYLALLIACAAQSISAVSTEEFYAEGAGKIAMDDDSHSPVIALDPALPFYGQNYSGCMVHTNGAILFSNDNITDTVPYNNDPFPLDIYKFIAPFYGDVDTRDGAGTVSYTEQPINLSNDENEQELNKTRSDISTAFPNYANFIPKYLITATWNDVGYFNRNSDKMNTFQCIIATDGTMSFSIFLYNKTEWTTQNDINNMTLNAIAKPAKVGFNEGSQNKSWEIPCSGTCFITHLPTTSNVGQPGVWVFRIDQEDISPACPSDDEQNQSYDEVLCSKGQWCLTGGLTYDFKCGCRTSWEGDMCMESTSPSPSPSPSGPGRNVCPFWNVGTIVLVVVGGLLIITLVLSLTLIFICIQKGKTGTTGTRTTCTGTRGTTGTRRTTGTRGTRTRSIGKTRLKTTIIQN